MRLILRLALAVIAAATLVQIVCADSNPVHLVTYVEVMPHSVASGAALLETYRGAGRKEAGNLRFDVFEEIARPNRFIIVEAWVDRGALDMHVHAATTTEFRKQLGAIQNAPYDERVTHALYAGRGADGNRAGAIYVVTHIDVIPQGKDDCMTALKAMSVDTPVDPGNISYEVLQQDNRANHFAVIEEWTDMKAVDGHAMAAHTRAFRAKLLPIAGALYDERIYKALQ